MSYIFWVLWWYASIFHQWHSWCHFDHMQLLNVSMTVISSMNFALRSLAFLNDYVRLYSYMNHTAISGIIVVWGGIHVRGVSWTRSQWKTMVWLLMLLRKHPEHLYQHKVQGTGYDEVCSSNVTTLRRFITLPSTLGFYFFSFFFYIENDELLRSWYQCHWYSKVVVNKKNAWFEFKYIHVSSIYFKVPFFSQ